MTRESGVLLRGHGIMEWRAHWSKKAPGMLIVQCWARKADHWKPIGVPVALDDAGQRTLVKTIIKRQWG